MGRFSFINRDTNNDILKKEIIELLINYGDQCIAEITRQLNSSIPTITKQINQLIADKLLVEKGKQNTNGGRKPSIYGLNPKAGYFIGVDIDRYHVSMAAIQFNGTLCHYQEDIPFTLENTRESLNHLSRLVRSQLSEMQLRPDEVLAYGFNLSGRINSRKGKSYSYGFEKDEPLAQTLESWLGSPVFIENDSRAMTYGEHLSCYNKVKDMLFLNLTWGLGMGMIVNGKIVYGKSGFAGEVGHFPMLHNNQICQCGKIGCLETEASGFALQRIISEKIAAGKSSVLSEKLTVNQIVTLEDILEAIREEDVLAIECIEEIGIVLGRAIAGLINIFNPELVVIGGALAQAGDYLMIPVKGTINKLALHFISGDTDICISKLGKQAGPVGACLLSRSKLLNLI